MTLIRSTVTENAASGGGGGIQPPDPRPGQRRVAQHCALWRRHRQRTRAPIILNDTSSVHHNTATFVGGIDVVQAFGVTLNDRSSVHDKTATSDGGGIEMIHTGAELNDASSVYNNGADRGAGVFRGTDAPLTIKHAALIRDNTATTGGSGIWSRHFAGLTNGVAGVKLLHNIPDDLFTEP